jgi:hypothetical protein
MGNMVMGECEDKQKNSYINKTNCKHFERGYGRLPLGNDYTCHGFFKECTSLKSRFQKIFSQAYSTICQ